MQVQLILPHSLILQVTNPHILLIARHLSDFLNLNLLHILLLEVVDLVNIDCESFLDVGSSGKVEVVVRELLEFYVAGLRVAAWSWGCGWAGVEFEGVGVYGVGGAYYVWNLHWILTIIQIKIGLNFIQVNNLFFLFLSYTANPPYLSPTHRSLYII